MRTTRLEDLDIRASAVTDGAITGRVILLGPQGGRRKKGDPPVKKPARPSSAPRRFRADRETRGKGTVQVCVGLPLDELESLDAMADRCQMSRSHFIRQSVKHFGAKVFPDGRPR